MKHKTYTMREIADYIIENYPDCCLAYNDANHNYSEESLIKELDDFFSYEVIGLCGCGDPCEVKKNIRDVLNIAYEHHLDDGLPHYESYEKFCNSIFDKFGCRSFYDNPLLSFMVYILNNKDLLEHGSSISGSWLTEIGDMCRQVYIKCEFEKQEEEEEKEEAERRAKSKIIDDKFREKFGVGFGEKVMEEFEKKMENLFENNSFFSNMADVRDIVQVDKEFFVEE